MRAGRITLCGSILATGIAACLEGHQLPRESGGLGGGGGFPPADGGAGAAANTDAGADGATHGSGGATGAGGRLTGAGGAGGAGGRLAGVGGTPAGAGGMPTGTGGMPGGVGGMPGGVGGMPGGVGGMPAGTGGATTISTPTRPQLTAAQASSETILNYLAASGNVAAPTVDGWGTTAIAGVGDVNGFIPTSTVGPSGATFTSVQAAIDAAATTATRVYIRVLPGTYRETVCFPATGPPVTLYSASADATQTVIAYDNSAGGVVPPPAGVLINPCSAPAPGATTVGTRGSATFAVLRPDVQVKNLTISNDFLEASAASNLQAVALYLQADRLIFENVRVLGNQATLYLTSPSVGTSVRTYFKACDIEGDLDFIFGRGTSVFDGCTIRFITGRVVGDLISPSTDARNPHGMLFINSNFTASPGTTSGSVALGRAWDEGQAATGYPAAVATGVYPNGQALIRDSTLGAHVTLGAPWLAAASTGRPFSTTATPPNRLFEFANTGPGSGH